MTSLRSLLTQMLVSMLRVLQTGLYSLCQFPNYFGEIGLWVAMWVLAALPNHWPQLWWASVSPLTTAFLLIYISGGAMVNTCLTTARLLNLAGCLAETRREHDPSHGMCFELAHPDA